ncbi:uncharacterized protein LOC128182486 [Crassostrea angulata]|uniref:Uncharacterized protein n=4 Tax=Magallana gigas TaxID=29159 RepID=A0A8W8IXP8_MAGGI|nr:uncharacterized protein LOC105344600 [Crassostrea gigas]XP_034330007.1 uncharacterized protein LOC105344600 [Crassostrea gigas]XP_034330008.1 uncharacterized protein LOC105344600 [Crassostrea gigas]XP_052707081.1 uncharacterized protein LOC128182486 [Crassostrea angulata]|eukprot:XP_011450709.2 PREDICTED: uncharacterized protein LOC105344600 [Crassostrea gigas]
MYSLVLTTTLIMVLTIADGKDVFITRSNSPICPPLAVCGNVFEFDRMMDDGSVEPERRHITNCFCNNSRVCPFNRENMIYQSRTQQEVLCEPVRDLPRCRPGMVARRMYVDSMDFNDKSYYAIRCICPLNLVPSSRPRVKATVYRNLQFEGFDRIHNYKCNEEDVEEYKK